MAQGYFCFADADEFTIMPAGKCLWCGNPVRKPGKKYCSRACYHAAPVADSTRAKMSLASKGKPKSSEHAANISKGTAGKPKPWHAGEGNPNFGNKAQGQPEAYRRFREGCTVRGQPWSQEDRDRHSVRMKGPCNAMRGTAHTADSKAAMSSAQVERYKSGVVHFRVARVSRPEKLIKEFLDSIGVESIIQYHIPGVQFFYDFYLPASGLLLEYQGDYWHANPAKYPSGSYLKIQHIGPVLVDLIWERDRRKREQAEAKGYRVAYVWESDFKARGMESVKCQLKTC